MSDQNGGKTEANEAESTPPGAQETHPDAESAREIHPPVIEGAAGGVTPPEETGAPEFETEAREAEPAADSEPKPAIAEAPARSGALLPVAILIGAVALGGGAYYLWDASVATPPEQPKIVAPAPPAPIPPAAPETNLPARPEQKPARDADKPAPTPPEATPVAKSETKIEAKSEAKSETKSDAEKAVADMAEKLAAAQAAVERLTERLQTVESQLAAPKNDARATISARESGPGNSGEAAARLVVAQSLLAALRQGDDYSSQLAALQNFGVDPTLLAPLRAGLSAPSASQLAAAFAALAPKLAAATAPPKPADEAKPPQDARGTILGFLAAEAHKLVRIRPAGEPDKDAAASQIETIEKDLRAGDLAAALSARRLLPAPALALSADWATAAQTRLDAEAAAKAELAQALQNLTKTKS